MENAKLGEWIHNYRTENKLSMADFAKQSGVSKAYIGFLEKGTVNPTAKILSRIAASLSMTLQDFLELVDGNEVITISAQVPTTSYFFVPDSISCGALENIAGRENLPQVSIPDAFLGEYAHDKDIIFMKVNGESMNRIIDNHSVIAVKTNITKEQLQNGDIVIASSNGCYTVKRFINDTAGKRIILRPDSTDPAFSDIIVPYELASDFRIIGKVVIYSVML